jgi:hypothetical protein
MTTEMPNHALQRTRHGVTVCNRGVPRADGTTVSLHRSAGAGSLSLGR